MFFSVFLHAAQFLLDLRPLFLFPAFTHSSPSMFFTTSHESISTTGTVIQTAHSGHISISAIHATMTAINSNKSLTCIFQPTFYILDTSFPDMAAVRRSSFLFPSNFGNEGDRDKAGHIISYPASKRPFFGVLFAAYS